MAYTAKLPYQLITGAHKEEFQQRMNEAYKNGYTVVGSFHVDPTGYYQGVHLRNDVERLCASKPISVVTATPVAAATETP